MTFEQLKEEDKKIFQIAIITENGCDFDKGKYSWRITNIFRGFIDDAVYQDLSEAVIENIKKEMLPEEGYTEFFFIENGEWQDVFWVRWFELAKINTNQG